MSKILPQGIRKRDVDDADSQSEISFPIVNLQFFKKSALNWNEMQLKAILFSLLGKTIH